MADKLFFLTIPGLRRQDLSHMPNVNQLMDAGEQRPLQHSAPCVTWPAQANMLTGTLAGQHGVVANGFYWRDENKVEMWTAWNEVIQRPQIWDRLKDQGVSSAAWFPMLSKGCGADFVCMPAPIHKPDGSEDLWCYTKPQEFYGELLDAMGHFPLQHFWGPMANIKSSQWIAESMTKAFEKFRPDFSYVYLPHLDYQAQKFGPNSEQAITSVKELDELIGNFSKQVAALSNGDQVHWIVASEYVISEVNHVTYPNRILREAGFLSFTDVDGKEHLDFANSRAWALTDHQFSHVFVKETADIDAVVKLFSNQAGISKALSGKARTEFNLDHSRAGEVVLLSSPGSWQAYYWWLDDKLAPNFAHTVDIHQKPGYDPVEMFFDMATKSVPLDATLIRGSHGLPAETPEDHGVLICSNKTLLQTYAAPTIKDTDLFDLCLQFFASNGS